MRAVTAQSLFDVKSTSSTQFEDQQTQDDTWICNVIYRITDCRTLRNSPLENHWTLELEKRAGPSSFWNAIATFRLFRIEFRKGAEVVLIEARKSLSAYGQLVRPIDFGAARGE
eukprot:1684839-Rhodomonas_salina.4